MKTNRYPASCAECGARVARRAGIIEKEGGKWRVYHLACHEEGEPKVVETYFPTTGNYHYQNSKGRCIDAPCCGCCT